MSDLQVDRSFAEIVDRFNADLADVLDVPQEEDPGTPRWALWVAGLCVVVSLAALVLIGLLWTERGRLDRLEGVSQRNAAGVEQNANAAEQLRSGLVEANARLRAAGEPQVSVSVVPVVGPAGAAGDPGPAGTNGRDGADGSPGPTGAVGGVGPAGMDGKDGAAGAPGKDGADGAPGKDGTAGKDGADGKPPAAIVFGGQTCLPDSSPGPGAQPTYVCAP